MLDTGKLYYCVDHFWSDSWIPGRATIEEWSKLDLCEGLEFSGLVMEILEYDRDLDQYLVYFPKLDVTDLLYPDAFGALVIKTNNIWRTLNA